MLESEALRGGRPRVSGGGSRVLQFEDILLGESGAPQCTRCTPANAEYLREAPRVLAAITGAVLHWPHGPGPNLSFTGAEPFHHPELFEFLGASVAAGASRIRLESNAHALGPPELADRVISAGVRHLTFPLLGSTSDTHDALTARGSYEKTIAGVEGFLGAAAKSTTRVHVTAHVPVCRHNLHDTPEIVTLASKTGANAVLLTINDVDLDVRQAGPWLEAACDTGVVYAIWVEVEGIPYGCASGWELHLASMYHRVEGTKSDVCEQCPLTGVCSGAMPGASSRVLSTFAPPPDADRTADRISRGFEPPRAGDR